MQRLCDKYNRAIDSIHQLVSSLNSAREFHAIMNHEQSCNCPVCSVSLDAACNKSWKYLVLFGLCLLMYCVVCVVEGDHPAYEAEQASFQWAFETHPAAGL